MSWTCQCKDCKKIRKAMEKKGELMVKHHGKPAPPKRPKPPKPPKY